MSSLSGLVKQLSRERDHVQRKLSALNAALIAFAGVYRNGTATTRRKLSAKGRARIVAAKKARWKKQASKRQESDATPPRTMSASARRKIAAAQRARWAKVKRKKKHA
jgi:hypothetical protein